MTTCPYCKCVQPAPPATRRRRCAHENTLDVMIGRWCRDCGAFRASSGFTDEDGVCYKRRTRWIPPRQPVQNGRRR